MLTWLPVPILAVSVTLLIRATERAPRDERQIKFWKPLSTLAVIVVGALSFSRPPSTYDPAYAWLILPG